MDIDSTIGNAVTQDMARDLIETQLKMHALQELVLKYRKKLASQHRLICTMKRTVQDLNDRINKGE